MYNGFIKSTSKNVGQWLYQNFRVTFKQGPSITVQELKEATVYEYLTKSKGDLRDRSKRILDEKWLPYKNHDALQIEKEKEKR
jgi:glutathione peroxidase-family protein